ISVRMARFGAVAQLTDLNDPEVKPEYAGLRTTQKLENINLEEALELFKLPRTVGKFEGEEVVAAIGRFGPYLRHKGKFTSLGKDNDPHTVDIETSIKVIEEKRKKDAEKTIKIFEEDPDFQILNGRWGPYLKAGKKNVRIPKDVDAASLTYEDCLKLVENSAQGKTKGSKAENKTETKKSAKEKKAKKASTKKTSAKKTASAPKKSSSKKKS
ncbi:MAG: topoisomerase C-terminal repeat-containing protein, partial [Ignavibacteriaceae bacterium]